MAGNGLAWVEKQRLCSQLLGADHLGCNDEERYPVTNGRESARLIFKTVTIDPPTRACRSYWPGRTYKWSSPQAFLSCEACIASSWVKGAVQYASPRQTT